MDSFLTKMLRRGPVVGDPVSDCALLQDFLLRQDCRAFEFLMSRHGQTVWGICRRLLRDPTDAEDAFQATFLILLRKATELQSRTNLGGWLYRVAFRAALKTRRAAARRQHREQSAAKAEVTEFAQEDHRDESQILREELFRLPERYRLAVLVCDFEGLSRKSAASQLGWKEGTLSGRLNRGRKLLADRLRARGVTFVVGAGLLTLPAKLSALTVQGCHKQLGIEAVNQSAPTAALTLAQGVLNDMARNSLLKFVSFMTVVAGLIGILGIGFSQGPREPAIVAAPVPKPAVDPADITHERVFLCGHQKIQVELKLAAEPRVSIIDGLVEIQEREWDHFSQFRNTDRPRSEQDFQLARQRLIAKNLTLDQYQRLKQIELQLCGPFAFNNPVVAKELGLSAEQKQIVTEAILRMYKNIQGKGAMRQAVIPFWDEQETPEEWAQAWETIWGKLKAEQRKKWDSIVGQKVMFNTRKTLSTFGSIGEQFKPRLQETAPGAVPLPMGIGRPPLLPQPEQPVPIPQGLPGTEAPSRVPRLPDDLPRLGNLLPGLELPRPNLTPAPSDRQPVAGPPIER